MFSKFLIKYKKWIFISLALLAVLLVCYISFMRQNVIETFTNSNNSISFRFISKTK